MLLATAFHTLMTQAFSFDPTKLGIRFLHSFCSTPRLLFLYFIFYILDDEECEL